MCKKISSENLRAPATGGPFSLATYKQKKSFILLSSFIFDGDYRTVNDIATNLEIPQTKSV